VRGILRPFLLGIALCDPSRRRSRPGLNALS
jgi:hypothetical protein